MRDLETPSLSVYLKLEHEGILPYSPMSSQTPGAREQVGPHTCHRAEDTTLGPRGQQLLKPGGRDEMAGYGGKEKGNHVTKDFKGSPLKACMEGRTSLRSRNLASNSLLTWPAAGPVPPTCWLLQKILGLPSFLKYM
ncbi:uncharacterized protein RHO17_021959 isoform 1-T2 [Thomomys bottae]